MYALLRRHINISKDCYNAPILNSLNLYRKEGEDINISQGAKLKKIFLLLFPPRIKYFEYLCYIIFSLLCATGGRPPAFHT